MQFLCDHMLAGLGKWLRVAGYDTKIIEGDSEDAKVLECAIVEGRILLTRDRHFLEMKAPENTICYLNSNSIPDCIKELKEKLNINWHLDPFSRCLICNSPLIKRHDPAFLELIPIDVQAKEFWYCQTCNKAYWKGSHTDRMQSQLEKWSQT